MFDRPVHMEPLFPRENKSLVELAMGVYADAAELAGMVHPITRKEIARLLRHINSYYSNRIEGEHTTPADIEKAVKKEYSTDESKKKLQLLSVAHIEVQKLIDHRFDSGEEVPVCSAEFLCWIHKEFYERVPDSFLSIYHPDRDEHLTMVPGELRKENVKVGDHFPPKWESVPEFLARFEKVYASESVYGHKKLMTAAASHQRLTWIHPFMDGNGRVSRLFTYAYLRKSGIESHGLWTLSRGLARRAEDYKNMLAVADRSRQGDYDGRGNLSEKSLTDFSVFFFEVAADQISFMKKLLSLDGLYNRIVSYVNRREDGAIPDENELRPEAKHILTEVMMRGEIARGEVPRLIGMSERTGNYLVKQLLEEELITSESHRAPLRFHIPAKVVGYYFPELYPAGSI
ncbi:Fic family protein [Gracilimonas mengyeensis]|uniref:Fic family protein n=1 Tax=Gracilimonas mengyeensis TaxID=1302730 RepID=A0A521BMN2_9BACT|nr:Fic family protein [Gracilimonas mengyeensis]SMO48398.1 Fic family protein [Gracilimonas mengyeensis]